MELPSEIYKLLLIIEREPGYIVMFAAFHPVALLLLSLPLQFLNNNIFKIRIKSDSTLYQLFAVVFVIGWIGSFMLSILLMFSDVPGIKILLIIMAIYLCATGFVLSVPGQVLELLEKYSALTDPETRKNWKKDLKKKKLTS